MTDTGAKRLSKVAKELNISVGTIVNFLSGKGLPVESNPNGKTNNPQVFLIDFSTLEGLKQGNMVLQSNDIVYVDIVQRPFLAVAGLIIPYLTIFNTVFFTYITFRQISR